MIDRNTGRDNFGGLEIGGVFANQVMRTEWANCDGGTVSKRGT